jgi:hypothetical protein
LTELAEDFIMTTYKTLAAAQRAAIKITAKTNLKHGVGYVHFSTVAGDGAWIVTELVGCYKYL